MTEHAPIAGRTRSVLSLLKSSPWPWVLLGVLMLLPFVGKPLHIDDPLFLWGAQHISAHPLDPFGYDVNWYGVLEPVHQVTCNPPLASYFQALVASVFGWSEVALHVAFLIPAALVLLGTWILARRWTRSPWLATAALLASPTFLVSASTLMCDVIMLAFWVWALVFWVRGTAENNVRWLALGALCALGAILSKYAGASVVGLMGLFSVLAVGWRPRWMFVLALPLLCWFAYEAWGRATYGHILLFHAASVAEGSQSSTAGALLVRGAATLTFLGGSAAYVLIASVSLLRRGQIVAVLAVAAIASGLLIAVAVVGWHKLQFADDLRVLTFFQAGLWIACALAILVLVVDGMKPVDGWKAVRQWRAASDPVAIGLAAWILGVVAFTWLLNWSVNGRTLLPLLPAVAILVARGWERRPGRGTAVKIGIASGLVLSVMLTAADAEIARSQRGAAETLVREASVPGATTWFQGHWGFQHYAAIAGGTAIEWNKSPVKSGDCVILPMRNTNVLGVPKERCLTSTKIEVELDSLLMTLDSRSAAGFYSHWYGILPFAVSAGEPDVFWVMVIR